MYIYIYEQYLKLMVGQTSYSTKMSTQFYRERTLVAVFFVFLANLVLLYNDCKW